MEPLDYTFADTDSNNDEDPLENWEDVDIPDFDDMNDHDD